MTQTTLGREQLQAIVKMSGAPLYVALEFDEALESYTVRLGIKYDKTIAVTPHELADANIMVRYLDDEVRRFRKQVMADFDLTEHTARAIEHRDALWRSQIMPLLLAAGIEPNMAGAILDQVKENIK